MTIWIKSGKGEYTSNDGSRRIVKDNNRFLWFPELNGQPMFTENGKPCGFKLLSAAKFRAEG